MVGRQHLLAERQADEWVAWLAGRWVGRMATRQMDGKAYKNEKDANRHMNRRQPLDEQASRHGNRWSGRPMVAKAGG
jgi:hypothetical protein